MTPRFNRYRRPACLLVALGLASPALQAIGGEPDFAAARLEAADCPVPAPDDRTRCFSLAVPENWGSPSSQRRIRMPVIVLKALSDTAQADPVVFLTGGPGVSPIPYLPLLSQLPLRAERDVIVVEPRGHGHADPALPCDSPAELAQCRDAFVHSGGDPDQYRTENLVHDLEALRRKLGLDEWNLVGVSYGTFWALHSARIHPRHLRSMILDSPYPPQVGYDWSPATALNALSHVFADCAATPQCHDRHPDLRNDFIHALRSLQKTPWQLDGTRIDGGAAFEIVYKALYESHSLAQTPAVIHALSTRDPALIGAAVQRKPPGKAYALGLNAAVMCADDLPFPALAGTRIAANDAWPDDLLPLIRSEGWDYPERCRAWTATPSQPMLNQPVHSDAPALILVGAFDPITPPAFAEITRAGLANGAVIVAPEASHAVLSTGNACVFRQVDAFLRAPADFQAQPCPKDGIDWK